MNYDEFLKTKEKSFISSGFEIDEKELNSNLFDFQKYIVKVALRKGRFAVFADCGLGKTLMQLEWANQVVKKTTNNVLILAPLAVVEQTIGEGEKFGIKINEYDNKVAELPFKGIYITNYDQLKNVDLSLFSGVVLDESSILKNSNGKTSSFIIDSFSHYQYKLA